MSIYQDLVDQHGFAVRLTEFQTHTGRIAQLTAGALDVGEGAGAVNLRLAFAEQVKVRTI